MEWNQQARNYEQAQVKTDSLDTLIEYPAQLRAIGDVKGKKILDIACGSGRKALDWINAGADEVYAFDISNQYEHPWACEENKPTNLHVFQCDLNHFSAHALLEGKTFDIVTSLQAVGYGANLVNIFKQIRKSLNPNGVFVYTTAHPMRYAVERSEKGDIGLAEAYHDKTPYSYPGVWNTSATSTVAPMTISERVNSLIEAGFVIERIEEPFMNPDLATKYPHKYEWMRKYFGMILYKARAPRDG